MAKTFRWNQPDRVGRKAIHLLQCPEAYTTANVLESFSRILLELIELEEARAEVELDPPTEEDLSRAVSEGLGSYNPSPDRFQSVLKNLGAIQYTACRHCGTTKRQDDYCPKCGR